METHLTDLDAAFLFKGAPNVSIHQRKRGLSSGARNLLG